MAVPRGFPGDRGALLRTTAAACLLLVSTAAWAKAHFVPKKEMVRRADVIAVVEVLEVKRLEPAMACGLQKARARVRQIIKGMVPDSFEFRVPCFYPCAMTVIGPGRYLVFLSGTGESLAGFNGEYSYRRIESGALGWFSDDSSLALRSAAAEGVIRELRAATTTTEVPTPR